MPARESIGLGTDMTNVTDGPVGTYGSQPFGQLGLFDSKVPLGKSPSASVDLKDFGSGFSGSIGRSAGTGSPPVPQTQEPKPPQEIDRAQ